jgi:hypothetical protein
MLDNCVCCCTAVIPPVAWLHQVFQFRIAYKRWQRKPLCLVTAATAITSTGCAVAAAFLLPINSFFNTLLKPETLQVQNHIINNLNKHFQQLTRYKCDSQPQVLRVQLSNAPDSISAQLISSQLSSAQFGSAQLTC